jgi:hypothetical protein
MDYDATFEEYLDCAADIRDFILFRNNWGIPFLPQEPGCPYLETDGDLDDEGGKWRCVPVTA